MTYDNYEYKGPVITKETTDQVDETVRADYLEETSAELTAPVNMGAFERDEGREERASGTGVGWLALIVSILSLFIAPFLLGITGIILGFVARGRGARSLGNWAVGIGVVSIVFGVFLAPFF